MTPGVSPSCPRCGYDLSGVTSTWSSACPLNVRCSECGEEWESATVFGFGRSRLVWPLDRARRDGTNTRGLREWFAVAWEAWRIVALRPGRFWSRPCRTSPGAGIAWLCTVVVSAHLTASVLGAAHRFLAPRLFPRSRAAGEQAADIASQFVRPFWSIDANGHVVFIRWSGLPIVILVFALAWNVLAAVWFVRDRRERAGSPAQSAAWRAAVFGLAWIPYWSFLRASDQACLLAGMVLHTWTAVEFEAPFFRAMNALQLVIPIWTAVWWYIALTRTRAFGHPRAAWSVMLIAAVIAALTIR